MTAIPEPNRAMPQLLRNYRELNFIDIVAFFHRNWRLIFGSTAVVGILVALITILFVPHQYEASAMLVIVPPKLASDLKPSILTVQGYQQLLESDAVIAEAKKRLVANGTLSAGSYLRLGDEIEAKIFASRRAEEMVLAPMLEAVARDRSAQRAAAIANEWAKVFVERTRAIMAGPTSATVMLVDKQYPEARDDVAGLEQERKQLQDGLQKRFDDATTAWDAKISAQKNETGDLVAAQKSETKRLLDAFSADKNLATRKVRLDAMRKAYADLQDEQARVNSQLDQKKLELEVVRKQLATTPQYLDVHKAITDDALWQSLKGTGSNGANWQEMQKRSLVSQEINPIYQDLATRATHAETEVFTLTPRATQLRSEIERISSEVRALEQELNSDSSEFEKLMQERAAGLQRLQEDRSNALNELLRNKQRDLDGISRERDARLAQLNRDITHEVELYTEIAKAYNQGVLAKAQLDVEDVRIGLPAVTPDSPRPRGTVHKALLAAIFGGILGLLIAAVREANAGQSR